MLIDTGNVAARIDTLALSINPPIALAGSDVGNLAALLSSAHLTNSSELSGERFVFKL